MPSGGGRPQRSEDGRRLHLTLNGYQATTTIFVPFDDRARAVLKELRFAGPSRDRLRCLQRYGVAVYPHQFKSLQAEGAVEEIHSGLWALCSDPNYDKRLGLRTSADASVALMI